MTRMKIHMRRKAYVALAMTLLVLSLLLAACGNSSTGNTSNGGNSNITTSPGQQTTQSTPTSTSGSDIQSINQQVQNGVQAVDNTQNDVNTADATATAEAGANQQP